MITKIRKYQDSWLTKAILALTALSFMSLFGISGYINSAGKNRAVIKVDNLEILQDEMNNKLQTAIRKTQKLFGDTIDIDDDLRKNILNDLVKQNLTNMIIERKAEKENVSISDQLIKQIISSQPEFMDANGRFNPQILRRQLSYFDISEQEYISQLKQDILSRHLVYSPVSGVKFPHFMDKYVSKIQNQQKVFQYIEIDPANLKIDRNISEEEIEQYYQDFAPQFEEAEKRDISFIELKTADLSKNFTPAEADIEAYYVQNSADYIIPEKREILQMVFDDEKEAKAALKRIKEGQNFYQVAKDLAHQDKATTNLGEVTPDSLLPELSLDAFEAKADEIVGPINSEFGWHILKITRIIPKKETPLAAVKDKIIKTLQQEQAYDQALNAINEVEDKIGSGADLKDIAKNYHVAIATVSGLKDNGHYDNLSNKKFANLVTSSDFIDLAFSYNENEVSQALETDDGFVIATVKKIEDAHAKNLDDVKPEIIKMWEENEKSAIAQEIVNDVVADLDNGDSLQDIAKRFKLNLNTTPLLKRGQAFASLNRTALADIYRLPLNQYDSVNVGGKTLIVMPIKVVNGAETKSNNDSVALNGEMGKEIEDNMTEELINSYAKDMDVRVKYRLLGLEN